MKRKLVKIPVHGEDISCFYQVAIFGRNDLYLSGYVKAT